MLPLQRKSGACVIVGNPDPARFHVAGYAAVSFLEGDDSLTVGVAVAVSATRNLNMQGNRCSGLVRVFVRMTGDARRSQMGSVQGKTGGVVLGNGEGSGHETSHGVAVLATSQVLCTHDLAEVEIGVAICAKTERQRALAVTGLVTRSASYTGMAALEGIASACVVESLGVADLPAGGRVTGKAIVPETSSVPVLVTVGTACKGDPPKCAMVSAGLLIEDPRVAPLTGHLHVLALEGETSSIVTEIGGRTPAREIVTIEATVSQLTAMLVGVASEALLSQA